MNDETAEHEALRAVTEGKRPMTWDLWSGKVEGSRVLTPEGRVVARRCAHAIAAFLGDAWLDWFRRKAPPLLSWLWWPINDAPHVYVRILELGLRLELLRERPGFGTVAKDARRDLGHFFHWLVQLEVAGLAFRHGWDVVFEPRVARGRADLLLRRDSESMLVEVKGLIPAELTREDTRLSERLSKKLLLRLRFEENVSFEGHINAGFTAETLEAWLEEIRSISRRVARAGLSVELTPPTGGRLVIHPGEERQESLSMEIREVDEMRRLTAEIREKAEQGKGDHPLWLRLDETLHFWHLSVPQDYPRDDFFEFVAQRVRSMISDLPHVAGVALSRHPGMGGIEVATGDHLGGLARSLVRMTSRQTHREALFVAGVHPGAQRQLEEWNAWYMGEDRWLDWALEERGDPRLGELIVYEQAQDMA